MLSHSPQKFRHPQVDRAELARLLGQLGKVGNNISQLARILNSEGSVEIPDLEQALKELTDMRAMVMSALGYRETTIQASKDIIMIIKASQRSGARNLASHLMNAHDNDHVMLHKLRGFAGQSLACRVT